MGKQSAEIKEGDDESDIASFFADVCGVDSEFDITRELWEKNLDKLVDIVNERSIRNTTYLIFGYFTLKLGATLPPHIRPKLLEAANWENDRYDWFEEKYAALRRFYLKDFQQKIRDYKPGNPTHLIFLKNRYKDLTDGVVGLDQFWKYVFSKKIFSVKHVNLDSCDLEEIPAPIFDLVNIETLSLEHNQIKEIPSGIGRLTSLKKLFLNNNQIIEISPNIGKLINLTALFLDDNKIAGLPESFGNLASLKRLYIQNNELFELPIPISNLASLESLFLDNNNIEHLPKTILDMKKLRRFYLENNRIKKIPSFLKEARIYVKI